MNETVPITTVAPEHQGEYRQSFNARATLDVDAVERLRETQRAVYDEAVEHHLAEGYSRDLAEYYGERTVDQGIDLYLAGQGLAPEDDRYQAYKDGLIDVSILNVSESDWAATFADETHTATGQSGRDKTRALYENITGEQYFAQDNTEHAEQLEQLETLRADLDSHRELLATLSAKRQGRLFGKGGEDYAEALATYNDKLAELGRLELKDQLADESLDTTQKRALAIDFQFDEQRKLRELTTEKLKNTKVGKVVEWWTKQSKVTQVALGVGVGIVGGVVAGAAVTAGAAGVAVVAAGVVKGASFARGYAKIDAKNGRGIAGLTKADEKEATDLTVAEGDDYFAATQNYLNKKFEQDTKTEQEKRRKAFGAAAARVGLGAIIGGAAADALTDITPGLIEGAKDWFAGPDTGASPEPTPVPETTGPEIMTPEETEPPVDPTPESPQPAPEQPETPEITYDPNFAIEHGEGGIHFFQDLGLTEYNWYEVAGELQQKFPGEFYAEGTDVRFAHPGQLSIEAQQFIKTRFGL